MGLVNEDDLDWTELDDRGMKLRRKQLGAAAGGEDLGCSLYELPPGEDAWPYHYHTGNEEAFYVLAGEGALRIAGETHPVGPGDYAALPADESGAHEVINDAGAPLRYLVVSTMNDPDVSVYPDSEKIGVFAGGSPGGSGERDVHGYYRIDDDVGYWEGEDGGEADR